MKRRRLDVHGSYKDQFQCLRQIKTLTISECRQVVSLLHEDDGGKRTCQRQKDLYPLALNCLHELRVPQSNGSTQSVYCMSLRELLPSKMATCPLFKALLRKVVHKDSRNVRLVLFCDDAQGGNVLSATAALKATCVYCCFPDFQPLHWMDSMWLTLCVLKHSDVAKCVGGIAGVMSALLEFYHSEFQHGIPFELDEGFDLMFVPRIIYMADHEGIRASLGCKGAAGVKPCIKCANILGQGRHHGSDDFHDITCVDPSKFDPMTQELEKLLGFNASILQASPLTRNSLRGFFDLECVQYDALHAYYSNGIVAQELGLFFTSFCEKVNGSLNVMKEYAEFAWTPVPGHSRKPMNLLFSEKLWKVGMDFRGDATVCLQVLPLIASFAEDVLREYPDMIPAIDSLQNLQAVSMCIKNCKIDIRESQHLLGLQTKHMTSMLRAYGVSESRPKLHYALHLQEQMRKHGILLDCWVCERKHKQYKSISNNGAVSKNCDTKQNFSRQTLLSLVSTELQSLVSIEKLTTVLQGKPVDYHEGTNLFDDDKSVPTLSTALEHFGIRYERGQYIRVGNAHAAEILCAVQREKNFYLLCDCFQPKGPQKIAGLSSWKRSTAANNSVHLIQMTNESNKFLRETVCMRQDENNIIWLLQ